MSLIKSKPRKLENAYWAWSNTLVPCALRPNKSDNVFLASSIQNIFTHIRLMVWSDFRNTKIESLLCSFESYTDALSSRSWLQEIKTMNFESLPASRWWIFTDLDMEGATDRTCLWNTVRYLDLHYNLPRTISHTCRFSPCKQLYLVCIRISSPFLYVVIGVATDGRGSSKTQSPQVWCCEVPTNGIQYCFHKIVTDRWNLIKSLSMDFLHPTRLEPNEFVIAGQLIIFLELHYTLLRSLGFFPPAPISST